jgi:hypothetical protein
MNRTAQLGVLAQLKTAIEKSHRLQVEVLGLMRSMTEIEQQVFGLDNAGLP